MAEAVVHVFEAVDVYEQHCQQPSDPAEPADRPGEPVDQQRTVGQPRERVEKGVADELALVGLALGKVTDEEAPKWQAVVFYTDRRNFCREMAAVARVDLHLSAHLCAIGPRRSRRPIRPIGEHLGKNGPVAVADPLDEALADDLVTEPAEHRFCSGVPVGDDARLVRPDESVLRRLQGPREDPLGAQPGGHLHPGSRHIRRGATNPQRLPRGLVLGARPGVRPADGTGIVPQAVLHVQYLARLGEAVL